VNTDQYFINYRCKSFTFACSHTSTSICFSDHLIKIDKPIYQIPVHILPAMCLSAWRDEQSSFLTKVASRIVTGVALGALAIIGVVDAVVRVSLAIFTYSFANVEFGLKQSIHFLTALQWHNAVDKKIIPKVIWT
jgi:hypothetical protein